MPGTRSRRSLAVAAASLAVFAAMAASIAGGLWDGLDARVDGALRNTGTMLALASVSAWHRPGAIVAITAIALFGLLGRRRWREATLLAAAVFGGAVLTHLVKHGVRRARPGLEALAGATDYAFPSGHVAQATLLYGSIVTIVWLGSASPGVRWAVAVAVAVLVLLVAWSRVSLGAHRFSDVVAAVPLAVGWIAVCRAATA